MLDFSDLAPQETTKAMPVQASKDLDLSDLGAQVVTPEEQLKIKEKKEYESPTATVKAAAAGAARGLTFGVSDAILRGFGQEKELAKLQAYQPGVSTAGEVLGTIGGAFIGPGALVAKGATAATRGIGSTLGRVAAKEALEGAAYGLGQTISEQSLGTPNSVAESLVANVGLGSIMGAGFGMASHGIAEGAQALKKQTAKVMKGEDAISQFVKGGPSLESEIAQPKADIERIREFAKAQGIPLTKAMESDSHLMAGIESMLSQSPTKFGTMMREEIKPTYQAFKNKTEELLKDVTEKSASEIGDNIKNELISRAHKLYDPASTSLNEIYNTAKNIEITPDMRSKLVNSLEEWGAKNTLLKSKARTAINDTIGNLSEDIYMPLTKISDIASDLGGLARSLKQTGEANQSRLVYQIQEKVNSFYERQIRRAAIENAMTQDEGKAIAKEFINEWKEGKKGWREFKTFVSDVGSEAGLGKVKDFSSFMDAVDNIDNAKLAQNLFDKKNSKSLEFVKNTFPDIFEELRQLEISKLRNIATKVDVNGNDFIDIKTLAKEIRKHDDRPEIMKMILGDDRLQTINHLEELAKKLPKKFGPTGTPEGLSFQNILKPALWASDAASWAIYKHGTLVSDVADAQTKAVVNSMKTFLTEAKKPVVGATTVGITSATRDYDQRLKEIRETAVNPDSYLKKIDEHTKGLDLDPNLKTSVANVTMQAVNYIDQKAPKNPFADSVFQSPVQWKPSDAEMSKFNRYLKAIDDPFSILQDLKEGMLTPESIDAVKTVYPELYSKMKQIAMDQVSNHKGSLPYTKQLQLSMFLGQPLSTSQDVNFVQRLQQNAKAQGMQEQAQGKGVPQTKGKSGKFDNSILNNQMGQSEQIIRSRGQ